MSLSTTGVLGAWNTLTWGLSPALGTRCMGTEKSPRLGHKVSLEDPAPCLEPTASHKCPSCASHGDMGQAKAGWSHFCVAGSHGGERSQVNDIINETRWGG